MSAMSQSKLPLEIDVVSVKALLDSGEPFLLLDVREPHEFAAAKIEGATLIPMREIPARLAELAPHKDSRVVVHCHHGGRSQRVMNFLRQQGFSQVQNMIGGIDDWSLQVDPSVPRYE
jgi:rhodanese-related sulfurtransferase